MIPTLPKPEAAPWRQPAAMILLGLATAASLFLALRSPAAGCPDGADCDGLLSGPFAGLFGIPAAWLGVEIYGLLILTAGAWSRREQTLAATLGAVLAGAAAGAGLWFILVQAFLLRQWCPWCLAAHLCCLTAVALLWQERRRTAPRPPRSAMADHRWTGAGAAAALILLPLGAWHAGAFPSPGTTDLRGRTAAAFSPPAAPGITVGTPVRMELAGQTITLDFASLPMLGDAHAARTAYLLTDYTCLHCREYDPILTALVPGLQPGLRLVILPAARDEDGAAIQRVMLTLDRTDRAAWQSLHHQLINGTMPARPGPVAEAARTSVGTEAWAAAVRTCQASVEAALAAAARVRFINRARFPQTSMLPQLIAGSSVLMGVTEDPASVIRFLNDNTLTAPALPPAPLPDAGTGAPALTLLSPVSKLGNVTPDSTVRTTLTILNRSRSPARVERADLDAG